MTYHWLQSFIMKLSCDECGNVTDTLSAPSLKEVQNKAYKNGWRIMPLTGKCRCPACKVKPGNHRSNRK